MKNRKRTSLINPLLAVGLALVGLQACTSEEIPPTATDTEKNFNTMPKIGDEFKLHMFLADDIDMESRYDGTTFDYETLPAYEADEEITIKVEAASSNSYASDFPGAEIVTTNNYYGSRGLSNPDKNYHFFTTSDNKLTKLGRVDEMSETNILVNPFGDKDIQLQYPFKVGSTSTDEFNGSFISANSQFYWDGQNSYEVDTYGKINLLGKTLDAYRVVRDRNYESDTPFGILSWEKKSYEWYVVGIPFPVLSIHNRNDYWFGYVMDPSHY